MARWRLGLKIVAMLAANVARGRRGSVGAAVAAWPSGAGHLLPGLLIAAIGSPQSASDGRPTAFSA